MVCITCGLGDSFHGIASPVILLIKFTLTSPATCSTLPQASVARAWRCGRGWGRGWSPARTLPRQCSGEWEREGVVRRPRPGLEWSYRCSLRIQSCPQAVSRSDVAWNGGLYMCVNTQTETKSPLMILWSLPWLRAQCTPSPPLSE